MPTYEHLGTTDGTWTAAANWDPGTGPPAAADTVIFNGRSTRALTGNPSSSIQLAAIKQYMSARFAFGTRAAPIACFADNIELGLESTDGGNGSGAEFHINAGTNVGSKVVVYNGLSTASDGLGKDPITIKTGTPSAGNHSLYVEGGTVGIATAAPADIATIPTLGMTGGRLNVGLGMVTGWTLTLSGTGNPKAFTNTGTSGSIIMYAGECTTEGTVLIATVSLYGGTLFCNHRVSASASITTLTLGGNNPSTPTLDLRGDPAGITITNTTLTKGKIIHADPAQITYTNKPTISLGNSTTLTLTLG